MNLWIGLHLHSLSLDVWRQRWLAEPEAWAVLAQGLVLDLSETARAAGIRPGMRRAGAAALAPSVLLLERDPSAETRAWDLAAQAGLRYTPTAVQAGRHTLLLDVGASLSLFGGPRALCRRLDSDLSALGLRVRLSLAPTPGAAWLLANRPAPGRRRAIQPRTAGRLLDKLPITLLETVAPHLSWLSGSGCLTLADLRRLPRAGLQRRAGTALTRELDAAYGRTPDIRRGYVPPERFDYRIDLVERLEGSDAVLALAGRLIAALCAWLAARQRAARAFELRMEHERGRHARPPSALTVALAEPGWRAGHLLAPLRERLARQRLDAPVIALALSASSLAELPTGACALFPDPALEPGEHRRLLGLLAARLGEDNVLQASPCADHRPETANAWRSALASAASAPHATGTDRSASTDTPPPTLPDRPFWLLPQPRELPVHGERPVVGTPLRLLRGPERLESGWWDRPLTMRDYFVAEDARHVRYWVYRERDADSPRWFLHGLFG